DDRYHVQPVVAVNNRNRLEQGNVQPPGGVDAEVMESRHSAAHRVLFDPLVFELWYKWGVDVCVLEFPDAGGDLAEHVIFGEVAQEKAPVAVAQEVAVVGDLEVEIF